MVPRLRKNEATATGLNFDSTHFTSARNYTELDRLGLPPGRQSDVYGHLFGAGAKDNDETRLNLDHATVRAPFDGRIGKAEVTVGNLVDRLANETGFPHEGRLDFWGNRLDPASSSVRMRAVLDNRSGVLTPGLFARVQLGAEAILINEAAVGTDQDRKYVVVVNADNKAEYRVVQLGPLVDGLRVARSGLKPGERIVVNGLQRVRPGAPVAPLEEAINGVENMLYMASQATGDGGMNLTVTFKVGTHVDQAKSQVQSRVQRTLPRLPEGLANALTSGRRHREGVTHVPAS